MLSTKGTSKKLQRQLSINPCIILTIFLLEKIINKPTIVGITAKIKKMQPYHSLEQRINVTQLFQQKN